MCIGQTNKKIDFCIESEAEIKNEQNKNNFTFVTVSIFRPILGDKSKGTKRPIISRHCKTSDSKT